MSVIHRISLYAAIAASLTVFAPTVALAQTVTFANVADTVTTNGGAFSGFGNPSINASGTVAFYADLNVGGRGIFTNTSGSNTTTTIADTATTNSGTFSGFGFGNPSINASGTVAFYAGLDAGGEGIYTNASGSGTANTIADSTTTSGGAFLVFTEASINDSETVAFRALLDNFDNGIFTNTNGSLTAETIADTTNTNGGAFSSFGTPSINASGTLVFGAFFDSVGEGIFTNIGGSQVATTIADTTNTNGGAFQFFDTPTINSGGAVVFRAILDAGGDGIFVNTSGSTTATTIADAVNTNGGIFFSFGAVSINSEGTVAFDALLDFGGEGVFAALSGSSTPFKVVQTGDSLFGSTVDTVDFYRYGLSDGNSVAFNYTLTDGRSGIAVAQINSPVVVPEADTLVLAAFGLFTGAGVVARRRAPR